MKILLVEDNKILSENIKSYLGLEKFEVTQLFEGNSVSYELIDWWYDLIIMDIGLPDIDGVTLAKQIRESGKNIPILMLTARNTITDKIAWFQSGADDYLTKPFEYEELLMRIQALVRRNFSQKWENIFIGDSLEIHTSKKEVLLSGSLVHLSQLEYDLLLYLAHNMWKVISKEELLEKVWWEYDAFKMTRTVDVYIGYLRKKLFKDVVETKRWEGYIIW